MVSNGLKICSAIRRLFIRYYILFIGVLLFFVCGCAFNDKKAIQDSAAVYTTKRESALNRLRDNINGVYGFLDCVPRVNLGPCGRFARDFREEWNATFDQKINIVFAMTADQKNCYHVLVKLPDGNYYDGGNGVMSGTFLYKLYPDGLVLNEMKNFEYDSLDKWSYSLKRSYKRCPDYSDDTTRAIIKRHLKTLKR